MPAIQPFEPGPAAASSIGRPAIGHYLGPPAADVPIACAGTGDEAPLSNKVEPASIRSGPPL
jgi:hypothetical protein